MDAAKPAGDVNELLARMQRVRACGYYHAEELHSEAKRLVDWKEYVRSKPLTSIAVASLVGFSIVHSTFCANSRTGQQHSSGNAVQTNSKSNKSISSSWESRVFELVASVATTAIKHYLASLLQPRRTEGGFNDRFRNNGSKGQRIGAAQ